ncbi:MAG: IS91 family transposase [Psychrosphaera sp.]|nr:IS91 family transposase [Psychrosphaera sp.]
MPRPALEVGDIFRTSGPHWRQTHKGHLHLDQLKVMSAIECCRTAALGGHVLQCADCGHQQIAYNSCRNRHCPKCQGSIAKQWLSARQAELLPVDYYHVVFTLPAIISDMAYQNKSLVYGLLFQAVSQTLQTIGRDKRHLGARLGAIMVLHTWGSALTHHPHIHCIVPGGGLSDDGEHWQSCKPGFFLSVRVLSRLFRRLFIEKLCKAFDKGELKFYGQHQPFTERGCFYRAINPLRKKEWVVYAKRPFAGPKAVLAYLSRYTHRVAIANSRLIAHDAQGVTFKWKDYRLKGRTKHKSMTLVTDEFIRRFLLHTLPKGFHRIRHMGIMANPVRKQRMAKVRQLLASPADTPAAPVATAVATGAAPICHHCTACGGDMDILWFFIRGQEPRGPPRLQHAA